MKHFYYLLMLCCVFQTSCDKGYDCPDGATGNPYIAIPDTERAMIPVSGTDTLIYISNTQDTVVAYAGPVDQYFYYGQWGVSAGDCSQKYGVSTEVLSIPFTNGIIYTYRAQCTMPLGGLFNVTSTQLNITLDGSEYVGIMKNLNDTLLYSSSVSINGKTYPCYKMGVYSKITKVYYHYRYGVLQYESDNKAYQLQIDE